MDNGSKQLECPACSSGDATSLFQARNGYPILRCSACALAFTDLRGAPPPPTLYPEFEQSEAIFAHALRRPLAVFTKQREALVREVMPRGRLLDFGCGSGAFARWMAHAGYDVVGLEPFSLGRAVEDHRLLLVRGPLESASTQLGRFDVITLWHVLEHLPHPSEVLRKLGDLLSPRGVIIVSVPNFRSWQSQVFQGGWFHLDPPRHIAHFETETLERCLHDAQLQTFRRWMFLPEYGSSGWVQSVLNGLLPHNNYLYELVKDRGALKGLPVASHLFHFATSLALSGPTFAATLPLEAMASAFDRGAALTVAARRSETADEFRAPAS
jgi:SAM-dependent methyltransferase